MNDFAQSLCGLYYGRDVVQRVYPLAAKSARVNPFKSTGVTDNERFAFLSQQPKRT